jgi:H+-transporting ATPase
MAPPNDMENGDVEKERMAMAADNDADLGEYGNLVKYISNYRDGRRSSVAGSIYDDAPKKKWYQFGKKKAVAGGETFDAPEAWLNTDWKQGLSTHDVEARRKKTGWNELTTEKENLFLKFLGFFTGPILYGKFPPPTSFHSPSQELFHHASCQLDSIDMFSLHSY